MSLRKRCSQSVRPLLRRGDPNPRYCQTSPRCGHPWHYDFRVNGRRYRASTETSDKHKARDIEARERSRLLDGRHGIRRQPDIGFREFATIYLRDHAEIHKRSVRRDREIIKTLNRFFGSLVLHEVTRHRIEQFKRERLSGRWRAHRQKRSPKPVQPATVNRELDTLKSIFSKAVEWGKMIESPARGIKRLRVENTRTRILSLDEQWRLLKACKPKLNGILTFALISSARIGEVLSLRWEQCQDGYITFLRTKNGKPRRIPISETLAAVLAEQPQLTAWVFTNPRTGRPFTDVASSFRRAVERAKITTGDVTIHTLRHTALTRMIEVGFDDYTVMEISGHSSTRMLARYTHPTDERKQDALESFSVVTNWSHRPGTGAAGASGREDEIPASDDPAWVGNGGPHEARTRDLRVANAALSQLS